MSTPSAPSPQPDAAASGAEQQNSASSASGLSAKGLSVAKVGVLGGALIGVSCIAPAYTLTSGLGPTVSEVGLQVPAVLLIGFVPMLLVLFGYRELNTAMPDSGTSFTWATRAFGPWIGWMAGWGLITATVLVLSNLAAVAVDWGTHCLKRSRTALKIQQRDVAQLGSAPDWGSGGRSPRSRSTAPSPSAAPTANGVPRS